MIQGILVSNKRMTGFTRKYLPLINYYLQVQKCTTGVTLSALLYVLCGVTCAHYVIRCVRLLVTVLSEFCATIMFGGVIQSELK